MDQASPQAAPAAQAAVPAAAEPSVEDQFQSLWDRGAFNSPEEAPKQPETAAEAPQAETPAQVAPEQQTAQETPDAAKTPPDQEKDYGSLTEYLTDQKIEPESFMQLPVTVKVDGTEQSVPLAEVVKGYQIASAGYQRMNEIAQQKQQFQTEQQQVRQALGTRITQVEALLKAAQDQLLGDYSRVTPDQWAKLRAENPGEYAAIAADFQQRQGALQQLIQQATQAKQAEAEAAKQQSLQAIPAEREKLLAARPEWRDPAKAADAQRKIAEAARKLGYTDAELQGITDHRQLLTLDLASRALQLQASQPGVLKRVRAAPKMAQPSARQARDPSRERITTAIERARASGYRDENAVADAFEALG